MRRTSEEQYLHELIESYVAPLRNEIRELRLQLNTKIVKNNDISPVVIKRFCNEQPVEWHGIRYWVGEDNGEDKVLITNGRKQQDSEYNDWWVNRNELNAL